MINFIFLLLSFFHPFYISVTEIKHNEKTKSIEISTKIFFDDLEADLENEYKVRIDIIKPANKAQIDNLLADYIKKNLMIKIDGKAYAANYLGYEIQGDAAWCYLEITKVAKVASIEINNGILYKLRQEQINMLNVTVGGKRQSTKLNYPERKVMMRF
jgi:hypothetical protein